jgi:hypothetical protein
MLVGVPAITASSTDLGCVTKDRCALGHVRELLAGVAPHRINGSSVHRDGSSADVVARQHRAILETG